MSAADSWTVLKNDYQTSFFIRLYFQVCQQVAGAIYQWFSIFCNFCQVPMLTPHPWALQSVSSSKAIWPWCFIESSQRLSRQLRGHLLMRAATARRKYSRIRREDKLLEIAVVAFHWWSWVAFSISSSSISTNNPPEKLWPALVPNELLSIGSLRSFCSVWRTGCH